jgi:hypothetical protein
MFWQQEGGRNRIRLTETKRNDVGGRRRSGPFGRRQVQIARSTEILTWISAIAMLLNSPQPSATSRIRLIILYLFITLL